MTDVRASSFLVDLLSQSLGPAVARDRVGKAMRELGLTESTLTQDDAQRVLEHLATEKGIVGMTSRFAKVRLALTWDAS